MISPSPVDDILLLEMAAEDEQEAMLLEMACYDILLDVVD